jgi:hypothetical protein
LFLFDLLPVDQFCPVGGQEGFGHVLQRLIEATTTDCYLFGS